MSFAVTVKVAGGLITDTNVSGDVPDGAFSMSGHSDPSYQSLSFSVYDPAGLTVANVNGYTAHPQPTPVDDHDETGNGF